MITDREKAIIKAMTWDFFCPYDHGVPLEGTYGPKTCGGSCYEEPKCDGNELMRSLDPELLEAVAVELARFQEEWFISVQENPDHPLHAWLAERDPEFKAYLDENPWGQDEVSP